MATRNVEKVQKTLIAALLAMSNAAFAAGFYSPSIGTPGSLGTAGVANPTNTKGADAAWTNPAGMTGIDREHMLNGLQFVLPSVKFNAESVRNNSVLPSFQGPVRGDNGGNAAEVAPIPSFFYVRPLSERLRFGLSSTTPTSAEVWTTGRISSGATPSAT